MKKLSKIYRKLGIDFEFPIRIKNSNGNTTYWEDSGGFWVKYGYDADGNENYYKNSYGEKRETPKEGTIKNKVFDKADLVFKARNGAIFKALDAYDEAIKAIALDAYNEAIKAKLETKEEV